VTTSCFDAAKPNEVESHLPSLCERLAAQLDDETRQDLHEFLVAIACNNNVEQTGMWLFVQMRAMKPLEEFETE
jgi:hypothetical protein